MTDEPKQAPKRVYVVRLTEAEAGDTGLPLWFRHKLAKTSPEHPDRQAELEELALAALRLGENRNEAFRAFTEAYTVASQFLDALEKFRSLEAK